MSDMRCERCEGELGWPFRYLYGEGNVCMECLEVEKVEARLQGKRPLEPSPFDPDLAPTGAHNTNIARMHGLKYDDQSRVYVDEDGCPTRDRFGQHLG